MIVIERGKKMDLYEKNSTKISRVGSNSFFIMLAKK